MRSALTPIVIKILKVFKNLLSSKSPTPVRRSAFRALTSITRTASAGEEASLLDILPLTLEAVKQEELSSDALNTLESLV